jgi:S-adenosylmethionine:tRNA ribosyltransferase-isomerase
MKPATWPRDHALEERMLRIDPAREVFDDARVGDLPEHLRAGDLLVVNDAATLPASLHGTVRGEPVELRLLEAPRPTEARAVLFGRGDWHALTEHRPAPPILHPGERVQFDESLSAEVVSIDAKHARLITLRFQSEGAALWSALYRVGKPVQYSYLRGPLALWTPQTVYASRPWAVEMPSAGRPLRWELLLALRRRGVELAYVTHAAGLSSTGDASLDAAFPLRERYEVSVAAVDAVTKARSSGGRVIAVGTSVVRALESAAQRSGELEASTGETELLIGPGFVPRVAQGLFTGMHEPQASHFALLQAFALRALLERAYAHAERVGYLGHEFGDSSLILP